MQWVKMHSLEITPRKFGTGNLLGREGKKPMGFHKMGSNAGEGPSAKSEQFPESGEKSAGYLLASCGRFFEHEIGLKRTYDMTCQMI
jgi:hypothetical protein